MTLELASKRLEYWMRSLDLYEHVECLAAAQSHKPLRQVLQRLGYKVPRGFELPKNRHRKYVTATDDWFPSYRDGKVAVTWYGDGRGVSVWGADDFGMEKLDASRGDYDSLVSDPPISQKSLREMGFIPA